MFRKALLDPNTFCVNWELIPGRGSRERQQEEVMRFAEAAARSKKIHGIGLTDNPGGGPAISAEFMAAEIVKLGIEPLVHFACRDKNRTELESMLYALSRCEADNLLILSGDYPTDGGFGVARPVFDVDPVHVLTLTRRMNAGLAYQYMGKTLTLPPTDFFCGAAVSPFKSTEAELMGQYWKLKKKIDAGARFVVTQVGYDARKLHELLTWLKTGGYDIPVLANIFVLTYPAAKAMREGRVPGCVVTARLLSMIEGERNAPDKGRAARLTRAAKQYAIAKGMGCAGAHIGGHGVNPEMVLEVIEHGEELSRDWERYAGEFDFPQAGGFYFFTRNNRSGLNTDTPSVRNQRPVYPPGYYFSRAVHLALFERRSPLFFLMRLGAKAVDSSRILTGIFATLENITKVLLYECQNCGDCALFDCAYLCPMSQCPKGQRNGPCGGSSEGWCEVYPGEKKCIWVRGYLRLKGTGSEGSMADNYVPPCDWALWRTSSWLNYFLGRDHLGKKIAG